MSTVNPLTALDVVLVDLDCRDPALDDEMSFDKYRDGRDPALIKERHGMRAVRFKLGNVTKPFLADAVDSMGSESSRNVMAFLASVHSYVDAAGNPHRAETTDTPFGQKIAPVEWMETVADEFGMPAVYELGRAARKRAALPKARQARSG